MRTQKKKEIQDDQRRLSNKNNKIAAETKETREKKKFQNIFTERK